jgi:calcineurin-like phosphoesterase family protein
MSKTFFTADTHFGSERTLTLSRRPFDNVEEMNRNLIEQYNKLVSDDDTVYHLGDFGDYSFAKQLSGKIVLI